MYAKVTVSIEIGDLHWHDVDFCSTNEVEVLILKSPVTQSKGSQQVVKYWMLALSGVCQCQYSNWSHFAIAAIQIGDSALGSLFHLVVLLETQSCRLRIDICNVPGKGIRLASLIGGGGSYTVYSSRECFLVLTVEESTHIVHS